MKKVFIQLLISILLCFSFPVYSQIVFNSPGNSISVGGEETLISVTHKNFPNYSSNLVVFAPIKEKEFNKKLEVYLSSKLEETHGIISTDRQTPTTKDINKVWCLLTAQPNSDTIRVDYNSDFLSKNKSKGLGLIKLLNNLYQTKFYVEIQQGTNILKYEYDSLGFSYSLEKNWVNETRIVGNTVILYNGPKEKSQPIKQWYKTERILRENSLEIFLTKEKLKLN